MAADRSPEHRWVMAGWSGVILALWLLAGCAAQPATTASDRPAAPPLAAGAARLWFLRQPDPTSGNIYASSPMIFVDRKPFAQISQGTYFFHDFAPGRYRLSVQAFGTPVGQHAVLHLDAGTETYVQVLATADWELGNVVGNWSFAILPMSPVVARQYLPILTDLGQR
jgi:Protein of unknown function (DUF2846)